MRGSIGRLVGSARARRARLPRGLVDGRSTKHKHKKRVAERSYGFKTETGASHDGMNEDKKWV